MIAEPALFWPTTRRQVLLVLTAAAAPGLGHGQQAAGVATPEETARMMAAVARFTGGKPATPGRVQLDIAPLVENGNTVPVAVRVDSPMTAMAFVKRIALFTERNPQPEVAVFELGALYGKPEVATRMRLATSQQVLALAELHDGSFWQTGVSVLVTLAACVEP